MAQEMAYDPAAVRLRQERPARRTLPNDLGFAGFRLNFHSDWKRDVAAFLGASYFRAVGGERQYGLSARGLAIDSGGDEEFPFFTDFWLERPADDAAHADDLCAARVAERRRRLSLRPPSG